MSLHQQFIRHIPIIWEGEAPPEMPDLPPAVEIGAQAISSAVIGGLNGMIKEGMASFQALQEGKIDQKQFTYRVIRKGTAGAVQQGSKSAAALTMRQGLIYTAKKIGSRRFLAFSKSHAVFSVCYGVVDQGIHTYQFFQGKLDEVQYKVQTTENIGSTGGAISGAALGAFLGSTVPGLGTVMGALIGMAGASGGASLGKSFGEKWFGKDNKPSGEQNPEQ